MLGFKAGANPTDQNVILRMQAEGETVEAVAVQLLIDPNTVKSFFKANKKKDPETGISRLQAEKVRLSAGGASAALMEQVRAEMGDDEEEEEETENPTPPRGQRGRQTQ